MKIVDSHCHLNLLPADLGSLDAVIEKANSLDVKGILCVAIHPAQWAEVLHLADRYENVYATIGVHPCEDADLMVSDADFLAAASHPKVLAIGEMGLDYYHYEPDADLTWQKNRFRQQVRLAKQLNKPLVIHTRNASQDCLSLLKEEGADQVGGVFHCFVEDLATAEQAMALGFYISIPGVVTFNSAKALQAVVKDLPLNRLLVETDAPYLTPVPFRGKPNQPGYTRYVVEQIAKLKGLSVAEVAEATTVNFNRLFKTQF